MHLDGRMEKKRKKNQKKHQLDVWEMNNGLKLFYIWFKYICFSQWLVVNWECLYIVNVKWVHLTQRGKWWDAQYKELNPLNVSNIAH